jgi:hypothetical protein
MTRYGRWIVPAALLAVCGCDLGSMYYFLAPEPKTEPEMRRIAAEDKTKESRVVVLVSAQYPDFTRPELIQADRQLAECLARQLQKQCADNDERVVIVAPRKVEDFKSSHPNWKTMEPREVGRAFKADYVIDVEIGAIGLYEKGSVNQLFRGSIELQVSLIDVNHPDASPEQRPEHYDYPSEARGAQPAFDSNPAEFRQLFLDYVGKRLAWKFTGHRPRESYYVE